MKRAAYQWGIGRYLYNLDPVWVPIKLSGKSYVIDGPPPTLPAWALPEGYKPPKQSAGQRNQETKSQTTKKTITAAQAKKMFELARGNAELVRQILEPYGYTKSKEILVENYDAICSEIRSEMERMMP